jgi:hypothetical protein
MEEVNIVQSKQISVKRAAKILDRFVRHRPEASKGDGIFTLDIDNDAQGAGRIQEERFIQLAYISAKLSELDALQK